MKLQIFSIRDSKAQTFGNPFFMGTVAVALRSVADEVQNNKESMLHAHPEDFELFHLGEFDPQNCTVDLFGSIRPLVVLSGLKNGG